jgi:hypothetical protein
MKKIIFLLLLVNSSLSFSQLSSYYLDKQVHNSGIYNSKGDANVTQMTYVNYQYVKNRVANFLESIKVSLIPISDEKITQKGEYQIITRRYKSKYNDEIVVERRFIDIEYKVFKIGNEEIVESFGISGLEEYIGTFFTEFWNPSLNLIEKNGLLYDFNFMQDNIKIKYKKNNKYYKRDVWMEVTNKDIKSTKNFTAAYKAHFDKLAKAKKEFDDKRSSQVFSIEKVSSTDYAQFTEKINSILINNRKEFKDAIKGSFELAIVGDTLGNQVVTISNSKDLPLDIVEELLKVKISAYKEQNLKMRTFDKYTFTLDSEIKVMNIFEKDFKKIVVTNEGQFTPDQCEKGINTVKNSNRGKGISEIQFRIQNINGKEFLDIEHLSFKSKMGVKKVASFAGGAVLLGAGVAYYFLFQ